MKNFVLSLIFVLAFVVDAYAHDRLPKAVVPMYCPNLYRNPPDSLFMKRWDVPCVMVTRAAAMDSCRQA